ncbi:MAG: AMP nucleosidase [Alphaproteobacteria bacterium]|nr:AMP nucleosidase [Alphaproteobacteria bacterium]
MIEAEKIAPVFLKDPDKACEQIIKIYETQTDFLRRSFKKFSTFGLTERHRAYYPYVRLQNKHFAQHDTRLSYGFIYNPGTYYTTLTRPKLFRRYLHEQFSLLLRNHHIPLEVGLSTTPIPIHFAFEEGIHLEGGLGSESLQLLREIFDVPDLAVVNDSIANGTYPTNDEDNRPLSLFTAPRVDYSLFRLKHYTATSCDHFQNFVLFTNYQFYVDEFVKYGRDLVKTGKSRYTAFVEPGDIITSLSQPAERNTQKTLSRLPQMPAYHLVAPQDHGVTLINIGVGPSNAKTITDHVAVLRPHAWIMLGHCAGLRNSQRLGDYVLAHGYVRMDHVLDADLPTWVPLPPLAEIQVALQQAVGAITGLQGYDLKKIMRTGTVATVADRNWEIRPQSEQIQQFSQSRAIALDMESATIAANGFRFRVPYGTLLCVSDKPLHGEMKLPGMASAFYNQQVSQHLKIGIHTMELLANLGLESLHSRKLRSFSETAFQ